MNATPLYNVALLVQNYPEMAFRTRDLEARLAKVEHGLALVDLRFVAEEKAGNIVVECEYNEELFDGRTIERLLEGYVSVLAQMTSDSPLRVSDIALPQ